MDGTTGPPAIETSYAGCRFRSRLEARWAVFFDALGVKWEYEKEGFELPLAGRYLPDFWLPAQALWVEIKGVISSRTDLEKLIYASRYLPGAGTNTITTDSASPYPVKGPGLVVLGQIPHVQEGWLTWHRGYRYQEEGTKYCPPVHYWTTTWYFQGSKLNLFWENGVDLGAENALNLNLNSPSVSKFDAHVDPDHAWQRWGLGADKQTAEAYAAARSARFEHGQSGPYRGAR